MRIRHLIPILIMLAGCSTSPPPRSTLTAEQAGVLAQRLANDKAQMLYHCQPFRNAPPAQFVQGRWTWRQQQAQGLGDIEATVEFAANGAEPKVTVVQLDSRSRQSLP